MKQYYDCNGVLLQVGQRVRFSVWENNGPVLAEGEVTDVSSPHCQITVKGPERMTYFRGTCSGVSDVYWCGGSYDRKQDKIIFDHREEEVFRFDHYCKANEFVEVLKND
jgi:hypothetical protein